jgi:glycosyltransferase involved in cell wall biosynthesis
MINTTTYNREHLLPRAVDSVLSQTFTDFSYVIINNGSTDNTQTIIDKYSEEDKRIISFSYPENTKNPQILNERYLLRKKKLEINFNYRFPPFYLNIDDDDFMEPDTVETLYRLITEYDADIASVGSKFVYPDGTMKDKFVFEGTFVFSRTEAMTELLKREKFNAASGGKLFRREIIENIEVPQAKVLRDIYSRYKMINRINRMVVTGEPLFYFYRHDKNQSGLDTAEQITPEKMRQHLEANAMRTEWLTEHMPEIKDFVFYCELSFMISLYERIHRLNVESCYKIAQEMKETLSQHNAFLLECGFCAQKELEILKQIGDLKC